MKPICLRPASNTRSSRLLCLVALATLAPHASAADAVATAPTDAQLADMKCIAGMERYVPGDYFYCLASQAYGRQRFDDADRFFHEAAGWGYKPAQFVLGVMALNGDHRPVDRPLAFAWLTLAAERGTERFQKLRQSVEHSLSASEAKAAEKLLDDMRSYRDAVAMPRAERRYADGMASLHEKRMAGNVCMDGMLGFGALTGGSPDPSAAGASPALAAKMGGACPTPTQLEEKINVVAANVFEDWHGHVSVGTLRQIPGN